MFEKRQRVHSPILAQVEASATSQASLGRARDLSVGGLLIETRETLPAGSAVVLRFALPPDTRPIEVAGRVVRTEPGRAMAIAFYALGESIQQRILAYVQENAAELAAPGGDYPSPQARRRSGRIPRRVAVVLNWQDEEGRPRQEAAETKLLSRYGALLAAYTPLEAGKVVRLKVPEQSNEARSRIVYSTAAELPGRVDVAVEFIGIDDFWGISFPEDSVTLLPTRRRSARLHRTLPVVLMWESAGGIRHQEATESVDISRHGTQLVASATGSFEPGRFLQVATAEPGRVAMARIVWRAATETAGRVRMGLEILGTEDFWGVPFPPDRDYTMPPPAPPPGA